MNGRQPIATVFSLHSLTMASQSVIQGYMDRHRIRALFEQLMNKILRDMPEEPLVYLLRAVYKKAGMEIPQAIRYGGLRKSTSDLQKSTSPERRSRSALVSSSTDFGASRLRSTSPTRLTKPKDGARSTKLKPEWNSDMKTKSSFDELWDESAAVKKEIISKSSALRKSNIKQPATSASAWATLGLGEDGDVYTSPTYNTRRQEQGQTKISDKELLALESVKQSSRSEPSAGLLSLAPVNSTGRCNHSRKMETLKHKQELGQILCDTKPKLTDSGIGLSQLINDEDDDAVELLENGDDLRREGVRNIPASGFKLSKNVRYRENEPCMKLSINAIVYPSETADKNDSPVTDRFSSDPQLEMNNSKKKADLDGEEEFESVSQVTGPRQPVWNLPDSEVITGDAIPLRPAFSTTAPYKSNVQHRTYTEKSLRAIAPTRVVGQSVDSMEDLGLAAKTWSVGGRTVYTDAKRAAPQSSRTAQSGSSGTGWRLPDDTEAASAYDWNQRVKGGPPRDPRAY